MLGNALLFKPRIIGVFCALAILLIVIAQYNYLFFHSLAEIISIQVVILIYVLGTETYELTKDNFLLFLGKAYIF